MAHVRRADYSSVNRQALQISLASYALLAAVSAGVLSAREMVEQLVIYPGLLAAFLGWRTHVANREDDSGIPHSQWFAGPLVDTFFLFFPVALGVGGALLVFMTGSTERLQWIAVALGGVIGQRVVDYVHDLRSPRD